jgi:putative ABC transport system substrate-binding protein
LRRVERRTFLLAGGALVFAPVLAGAQRAAGLSTVGFVSPTSPGRRNDAFVAALAELGYAEGRNIHVEMRFADGRPERLPGLVAELIALKVDLLVAGGTVGARAAKQATQSLPIVFAGSSDPVAGGIVSNLARPEGNLTGTATAYGDGLAAKWLELLREAVPAIAHFAALWNPTNAAAARFVRELESAARTTKARLDPYAAANVVELDAALAAIAGSGARGLIVTPSPFAATEVERLVRFAADRRMPAIYFDEAFAEAGGFMSYGPSIVDAYRRAAAYVDRILKGAKPGDLPVEQPTRFETIVNLRAATALGVALPPSIRLRADRLIE